MRRAGVAKRRFTASRDEIDNYVLSVTVMLTPSLHHIHIQMNVMWQTLIFTLVVVSGGQR